MTLEGRLLLFDSVSINNDIFTKDCELKNPEAVPLFWNFVFVRAIGSCEVTRDEKGLLVKAVIFPEFENHVKLVLDNNGIGVGGYYNCVKIHRDDQLTVVDKATLKAASLVLNPVREEYYLKEVK